MQQGKRRQQVRLFKDSGHTADAAAVRPRSPLPIADLFVFPEAFIFPRASGQRGLEPRWRRFGDRIYRVGRSVGRFSRHRVVTRPSSAAVPISRTLGLGLLPAESGFERTRGVDGLITMPEA